jgi:predicted nucleic-acid-binding Zn-ribbon protein
MKLSGDEVKRFADALMAKMGSPKPCLICGVEEWVVPSSAFASGAPPGEGEKWLHLPAHFLAMKCRNCGHTLLFDADVYGFSPGEEDSSDEGGGKGE